MAIDANDILAKLPRERREAIEARAKKLIAEEVGLAELRKILKKTQAQVAKRMKVQQAQVSKIERRSDILLSTMRDYIEAAGGSMRIIVSIPNHDDLRLNFGCKAARAKARIKAAAKGRRTAAGTTHASTITSKGQGGAGHEKVEHSVTRPKRAKV